MIVCPNLPWQWQNKTRIDLFQNRVYYGQELQIRTPDPTTAWWTARTWSKQMNPPVPQFKNKWGGRGCSNLWSVLQRAGSVPGNVYGCTIAPLGDAWCLNTGVAQYLPGSCGRANRRVLRQWKVTERKKWSAFVLRLDLKTPFTHFCPDIPTKILCGVGLLASLKCGPSLPCMLFILKFNISQTVIDVPMFTHRRKFTLFCVTAFDPLVIDGILNTNPCSLMHNGSFDFLCQS